MRKLKIRICETEGCEAEFQPRNILNVYCPDCQIVRANNRKNLCNNDTHWQRNFYTHDRYATFMRTALRG